jgi:hypothetical protein
VGYWNHFGSALAAADVNGDGLADLTIGIPGRTVDNFEYAGAIQDLFGTTSGLTAKGTSSFDLDTPGVKGQPAAQQSCDEDSGCSPDGELFGSVLAAGDIDGDGYDDVAIGVPNKYVYPAYHRPDSDFGHDGALSVLFGSPYGLTPRSQFFTYNTRGMPGRVEAQSNIDIRFANRLVVGDFDADGRADVAVVAPPAQSRTCSCKRSDNVLVLHGTTHGLSDRRLVRLNSSDLDRASSSAYARGFGASMLALDVNGDGADDLLLGAPMQPVSGKGEGGAVFLYRSTRNGELTKATFLTARKPFGGTNTSYTEFGIVGSQEA